MLLFDVLGDGQELLALRAVDEVFLVGANHRLVRGDDHHVELVDLVELGRFGVGRAGHARELAVQAEEVLERDGRQRDALVLDGEALFGFDGLVQTIGPAPSRENASGVLVDDHRLLVAHQVVLVAQVERVSAEALLQDVQGLEVDRVVEVSALRRVAIGAIAGREQPLRAQEHLGVLHALFGERHRARLLVDLVMLVAPKLRDELGDLDVLLAGRFSGPADDQGSARFVDQDRVDLVDDGVVQITLYVVVDAELHVVAHVVEAELVVLPVRDVRGVGALLRGVGRLGYDHTDFEAEEAVHLTHPLCVALREVVVDGDDVHALALERVEVTGEGGDERLALARAHLGDLALVQHGPADELHVVGTHPEHPLGSFSDGRERGHQEVVEGGAVVDLLPELVGAGAELIVGELLDLRLERADRVDHRLELLDLSLVLAAQDLLQQSKHAPYGSDRGAKRPSYNEKKRTLGRPLGVRNGSKPVGAVDQGLSCRRCSRGRSSRERPRRRSP